MNVQKNNFYKDLHAKKIPVTANFRITSFLSGEAETFEWFRQGLSTDEHSIQNGILVTNSSRWPLFIDPQGQGIAWIRNKEASNNLRVTSFSESDTHFRSHLKDCLSFGKPLLIENLEEDVDHFIDPVLNKAFFKDKGGFKIILDDKQVGHALFHEHVHAHVHAHGHTHGRTHVLMHLHWLKSRSTMTRRSRCLWQRGCLTHTTHLSSLRKSRSLILL